MKKKIFPVVIFLAFYFFSANAQDSVYNMKTYTYAEMKNNWTNFMGDAGWKVVNTDIKNKGFALVDSAKTMWGAEGYVINPLTKTRGKVVFCAYDFFDKAEKKMASLIWVKNGSKVYKASIEFPRGEKNIDSAYAHSVEYYADGNNKLQVAHSFGKCWRKHVKSNCKSYCAAFIVPCAGIAAAFVETGPWTTVAVFLGCTTGGCASCFLLQAITCMD